MIRLACENDQEHLLRFCKKDKWSGTMVWSSFVSKQRDVQNIDWQYCDIWMGTADSLQATPQYALCRAGQTFYLLGTPHSEIRWEELHRFLAMNQGKLKADCRTAAEYRQHFPLNDAQKKSIPCHSGPKMVCKTLTKRDCSQVTACRSVWQFYDVLAAEDKNLRENLSPDDFAARLLFQHRGGAKSFEIRIGEKPVSVGTVIMPPKWKYALIVNLCTLPEYRGRGYASAIVQKLCEESFASHKIPLLEGARESLEQFYCRLGFERAGFWQSVRL